MSRILLRSGKDPFPPISPEASLARNVFSSNSGNVLFGQAMHKILSVPGTEVIADCYVPDRRNLEPETVARINAEFDAYVIPLANAFRPSFKYQLARLTRFIRRLEIPVVVTGVGAQAGMNAFELADDLKEPVADFMAAVLDRSAKVGVRGEITRRCLAALGFGDDHVEVIGCPSLYAAGRNLTVHKDDHGLGPDSPITANLTLSQVTLGKIINQAVDRYPEMIYVPQTFNELKLLLWGVSLPQPLDPSMPATLDHPLYRQGRVRFFLDPVRWHRFLADRSFTFGSRIHGNIAALSVGTPAYLLAFDSPTVELADYHAIPYAIASSVSPTTDPAELYDRADFGAFNATHPENFERFIGFLDKNELAHTFQLGMENPDFDRRLDQVDFPDPVRPVFGTGDRAIEQVLDRLRWLYQGEDVDRARRQDAYDPRPFGRLEKRVPVEPKTGNRMVRRLQQLRRRTGRRSAA